MKISELLEAGKSENKYDVAIRMCYRIFYSIGTIVFFSIGLRYMKLWVWLLSLVCCALGATAYGTIAKKIITMIRENLEDGKKVKIESVLKLVYLLIFSFAAIIFVAAGIEKGTVTAWLIAFVSSFGGAVIYSALARLIITFLRKDK